MMQSTKPNISFFCPAYYDEKNLPRLIDGVIQVLNEVADEYEILIIEDGSPDETGQVADDLAKTYPNVKVVHHAENQGYGATIAHGFNLAKKYEWVFTTDGDCQYDPRELKQFLSYMNEYDAIVGYRLSRNLTKWRWFQTTVYNFLVQLLFGLNIKDVNTSFKVVRRSVLEQFELNSKSAFIDAELLLKLRQRGAKIMELPVNHFPRLYGQASGANPHVVVSNIFEMLKYFVFKRL